MSDPVSAFLECHERIRRFTLGLSRLAEMDDLRDPRVPPTAEACARYFREGLPLHGRDEDESLAPRLRAHEPGPDVVAALDRMTAEHGEMDRILPILLPLLEAIGRAEAIDVERFRNVAAAFNLIMLEHITLEEKVIFPACGALTPDEGAAIAEEIRRRRQP